MRNAVKRTHGRPSVGDTRCRYAQNQTGQKNFCMFLDPLLGPRPGDVVWLKADPDGSMKSPTVPATCGGGGRTCWCNDGDVGDPAYPGNAKDVTGETGGDARGCELDAERHGYLWNPTSSTAGASVAATERSMVYRMTASTSVSTTICCEMVWTTVSHTRIQST